MSDTPLSITQKYIAARVADRHETQLVATAHVVQSMTDAQARKVHAMLVDRPLMVADADLAQLVAQRIGVALDWWHLDLVPGAEWQCGRKQIA